MWRYTLEEMHQIAKNEGNSFWQDVSREQEYQMLKKLCLAAVSDGVLTGNQIQEFLIHVRGINAPDRSLHPLPGLNDLMLELLVVDAKLSPLCLKFFGRRLIPENERSLLSRSLNGDPDQFTNTPTPGRNHSVIRC